MLTAWYQFDQIFSRNADCTAELESIFQHVYERIVVAGYLITIGSLDDDSIDISVIQVQDRKRVTNFQFTDLRI